MMAAKMIASVILLLIFTGQAFARYKEGSTVPLQYDDQLRRAGFPSPLLRATVAGKSVYFLVDSGASVHAFASWFVRDSALPQRHDQAMQVNDVDVATVHDIDLTLASGNTLKIDEAAVADFPDVFEKNAIAGIVSPQSFASDDEAAVLDLRTPELRFEEMQSAMDRLHARVLSLGATTRVCVESTRARTHRIYAIRATIQGIETSLVVDTGAPKTSLHAGTPAAAAARATLGKSHDQMGLFGQRARVWQSAPLKVDFGAGVRRIPIHIGAVPTPCNSQGLLGMDALQGCRWIFARSTLAVSCPH